MKLFPILLFVMLSGCAPRYFTPDEEAQFQKLCGPDKSCTVLPNAQWDAVEQFINMCLGADKGAI